MTIMEQINEQWRPIEGYEGQYEVSNLGRVRSLERIDNNNHPVKERILRQKLEPTGYLRVLLSKKGKRKNFFVHRLVAQAFLPNPEGLPQINHKDEDKTNNLVDNLEYCDGKYNMNYGTRSERDVQAKISKGIYDPEMCGIWNIDEKEYHRLYYQKNRGKMMERSREYYQKNRDQINERRREHRRRKKQVV